MSTNPPGGAGSSTGGGGPCGACKFLRRKCVADCIFAPYFDSEQGASHFATVHKVFGASNVSKLLLNIPVHKRVDAVVTICYEAQARLRDPVYGCVAHLFSLQQQVASLQAELSYLQAHLASLEVPTPPPPPLPPQPPTPPAGFSIANLPITSCFPANYDLSVLFDPVIQASAHTMQAPARQAVPMQFSGSNTGTPPPHSGGSGGSSDLHELARELLQRQNTGSIEVSSLSLPPHDTR
ncbi:putative transcription factor AS2-LOB family [Helianthus annuus]|nr:putative transcription factor AS2-LOB family [Helianthus annuus]KAJ0932853.1 putative transcription factor AS2-LOB family [Helianthus annuus]